MSGQLELFAFWDRAVVAFLLCFFLSEEVVRKGKLSPFTRPAVETGWQYERSNPLVLISSLGIDPESFAVNGLHDSLWMEY